MSSNIYTLKELVDLALQTPEVGSVNFNIIKIVLHAIISELHLEDKTAEWIPATTVTGISKAFAETDLPDHPLLTREEGESDKVESTRRDIKVETRETEKKKELIRKDASIMTEESDFEDEDESSSSLISSSETDYQKEEDDKEGVEGEHVPRKTKSDPPTKAYAAAGNLWKVWQIRKVLKRVEAAEEGLRDLITSVDELKDLTRGKRIKYEDGERRERGEGIVDRDEFEDTVDELGEAITVVAIRVRKQKEECETVNESLLKEMNLKASLDDLTNNNEPIDKKLSALATAVKDIQNLIKDVIFPEASGVTKCLCCGRKAHLPGKCLFKYESFKTNKPKSDELKTRFIGKRPDKSPPDDLKFTKICMARLKEQNLETKVEDGGYNDKSTAAEEKTSTDAKYLVNLESFCDVEDLTRSFAPLRLMDDVRRRNVISVPVVRPITKSASCNDTSHMFTKRQVF